MLVALNDSYVVPPDTLTEVNVTSNDKSGVASFHQMEYGSAAYQLPYAAQPQPFADYRTVLTLVVGGVVAFDPRPEALPPGTRVSFTYRLWPLEGAEGVPASAPAVVLFYVDGPLPPAPGAQGRRGGGARRRPRPMQPKANGPVGLLAGCCAVRTVTV